MSVRNVVFDVGGVLLEWNPPEVVARLYPDPAQQAVIRRQMFEHADWHEFDRGGLSEDEAAAHKDQRPARKYYKLTPSGKAALSDAISRYRRLEGTLTRKPKRTTA